MKKIAWLSDIHLNFNKEGIGDLAREISGKDVDYVLITGDTSLSGDVCSDLEKLRSSVNVEKIVFLLGNHDFWGSSFEIVSNNAKALSTDALTYLSCQPKGIKLTEKTILVGSDGWYDAGLFVRQGRVYMNDWDYISDYHEFKNIESIVNFSKSVAERHNRYIVEQIREAIADGAQNVMIATHVPPFVHGAQQKCRQQARRTEDIFPWYCNLSLGKMLEDVVDKNSNIKFSVYSGHVHADTEEKIRDNLLSKTSDAMYGNPRVSEILEIE